MPKRSRKPKLEKVAPPTPVVAEMAEFQAPETFEVPMQEGKNPAAVALGRLGGKKGGPARAAKLSKKRLSDIGKIAAAARWGKKSA